MNRHQPHWQNNNSWIFKTGSSTWTNVFVWVRAEFLWHQCELRLKTWGLFWKYSFLPQTKVKTTTCTKCPVGPREYFKRLNTVWEDVFFFGFFLVGGLFFYLIHLKCCCWWLTSTKNSSLMLWGIKYITFKSSQEIPIWCVVVLFLHCSGLEKYALVRSNL